MSDMQNVKVFGEGTLGEGVYNKINIFGEASSIGNIECENLKVLGDLDLKGTLKVNNKFDVMGSVNLEKEGVINTLKIMGELKTIERIEVTEILKVIGEFNLKGYMKLKDGKILGEVTSEDSIEFDNLKVTGELTCYNCQGNEITSQGRLNIANLLSADKIMVEPSWNSDINEIGGSEIIIKKSKNKNWNRNGRLTSKLIEGDNIILQNTICDIVRGENIIILDNCEIKRVEYKNKLEIDKKSNVGESICLKN